MVKYYYLKLLILLKENLRIRPEILELKPNKIWLLWENFKRSMLISKGKLIFLFIYTRIFQDLVVLYTSRKQHHFQQHFFAFEEGASPITPAGVPV